LRMSVPQLRHPACESLSCPRRTNPTQEVTRHGNKTRNVWRDAGHRLHAPIPIDPRDFPILIGDAVAQGEGRDFPSARQAGAAHHRVARRRHSRVAPNAKPSDLAKLPNHRLVKIHRSYTVEDAAHCLGVHKNTVRRWIKIGLPTVGGRGKTLILGSQLHPFLVSRRKAAAPLPTRTLLLPEVQGAAAAGCGHDGIRTHHSDVGQP
jgi:excisionase family DNA binding protein